MIFDYAGYTEDQLTALCDDKNTDKGLSEYLYWASEAYAFGASLRQYGYYPKFLPLNVYSEHGFTLLKDFQAHELNNDAYCMLCHNKARTQQWKSLSKKPCYTMLSPAIFYRRSHKIEQTNDAKGTIIFPAHSVPDCSDMSNVDEYINQIKNLPEKFHPICVSLHMHDINKGLHKKYIEEGIPVYTAGNVFDIKFNQRYYDILKNFKYSMSNDLGSYMLYSVEMGIPFSIYGNRPQFIYKNSPHVEDGQIDINQLYSKYDEALNLFSGDPCTITNEQKEYTYEKMGINDGISRLKMAKVLYTAYFKYFMTGKPITKALKYIKKYPFFFLRKSFWGIFTK